MPVSAKQLNFSSISNDFDKFYNQNQETLLSLLDEFINSYFALQKVPMDLENSIIFDK